MSERSYKLAQANPDEPATQEQNPEDNKGKGRAEEKQRNEAERAARQQQKDAERAARQQQKQQEDAERAAQQQQKDAERAARQQQKQQEDAERAAQQQQKDAERAARQQQNQQEEAERAAQQQQKQQDDTERAAQQQQKDAERAARQQQKQQEEAERAAQQQQKDAERAARQQQKQQDDAERAAQQQEKDAERAARQQQKQQDERERAAKERQEQAKDAEQAGKEKRKQEVEDERAAKQQQKQQQEDADRTARERREDADRAVKQPQTDPARLDPKSEEVGRDVPRARERSFAPKDEKQAVDQLKDERARADAEFEKAKREAARAPVEGEKREGRGGREATQAFEQVRRQRREHLEDNGQRAVIEEPDDRRIILEKDRAFVRHDEERRFARLGKRVKRERRDDGTTLSIYLSVGGVEIIMVEDEDGRLLRRSRRGPGGKEIVLFDNSRFYKSRQRGGYGNVFLRLPPPSVRISRSSYIVDYEEASEEELYEALIAPPVERLDRRYSLEEVRYGYGLRERMRRVDLDAITFAFGSWEVEEDQYPRLERIARVLKRVLQRNPDEMFMIEGHTDAVGSDIDNLSLSDRRAESVAIVLSDTFRVPPENLTTQGYGEEYLKVPTEEPSRVNRRVAVRRITPLLSQAD
jgi:outer membrane protein OmpA-like peptidoglycan-associated protein